MRLRELKYPLLTANVYGMGDISSPRHWNRLVAEGFLGGAADTEVIFDSSGREYRFVSIELRDVSRLSSFLELAGYFFIPPKNKSWTVAYVDGSLEVVKEHSLASMKQRIRDILAENPHWRSGVSRNELETELQEIIEVATSPKHLIKSVFFMHGKRKAKLSESQITVDHRTKKRSY